MSKGWFIWSIRVEGLLSGYNNRKCPEWTDNIHNALQYESSDTAFMAIEDLQIKGAIPEELVIPTEMNSRQRTSRTWDYEIYESRNPIIDKIL